MALAVGEQRMSRFRQRGVEADCGHGVLHCPPAADVHVDVAAGDCGNLQLSREFLQRLKATGVIRAAVQFDGQPGSLWKPRLEPFRLAWIRIVAWNPECE